MDSRALPGSIDFFSRGINRLRYINTLKEETDKRDKTGTPFSLTPLNQGVKLAVKGVNRRKRYAHQRQKHRVNKKKKRDQDQDKEETKRQDSKSELRVYRTAQQRRTDNIDRLMLVEKEDSNGPENANAIRLILNLRVFFFFFFFLLSPFALFVSSRSWLA